MSERHLPFSSDYRVQSDDDQGLLAPTERRLLAEEVVDRLRNAILAGQLAPAQRISEDHLARMLRVSRGPVREALTRLEQE
ncbi:MAG: GntR family transcriptional regulator, partial [Actinobacteria bacterium]|nr:GntR family transcriptional regulator [Actinomycetota bacterium]